MNLLRMFRAAKEPVPILSAPAPAPAWTALDRDRWRGVLDSEIGRKFVARARAVHYSMLDAASKDHFHAAQSVHAARGFAEFLQWAISLSLSASAPAENTGTPGEASSRETPAQFDELLFREYTERVSP